MAALSGGGASALLLGISKALFDHFFGRKKLSADAAQVIEESASSAVKRVDADNQRLRERLDKVESMLDEVKGELRNRDRRIDEMSDELVAFREYSIELRDALQSQDPALRLPQPPARIARHFQPP